MTDALPGLIPQVVGILVRRGHDRAAAEDAVQEAAIEALRRWPEQQPDETDWSQIASWYDELLRFSGGMVILLNRILGVDCTNLADSSGIRNCQQGLHEPRADFP